ncbi:LapD/MoxY N-terminal periplasmic domain-containing protein [Comamonas faecalis]|uniref:LapD/MoxY N-terminal periplasmic domain-containing protein n=1 Tax=Comamonas faecalis TaxID=1387849 RepID=A0ABP7QT13_9BURK
MSLLSRLLLSVTVAIAVILAGTLAWSVVAARQYLDAQLQSQADNAASALALALSQPGNQDSVTRELLMMALFDSGQFDAITLTAPQGARLFAREQPPQARQPGQAPAWFVRLLPLRQARVERAVSSGWSQVGQLQLAVGNRFAYDALWRSSTRMGALVLVAGLAWALFVALLLRWFRRVLRREVQAQVLAIGAPAHPSAGHAATAFTELQPVLSAIQSTRERVRATAEERELRIESLQLELHTDAVTGMANRRYLLNELRRALDGAAGGTRATPGHALLFRQRDLAALNAHTNHADVDLWLASVGQRCQAVLQAAQSRLPQGAQPLLGRLNGSDFALLLPTLPGPQAMALVDQLHQVLQALRLPLGGTQYSRWACALTDYLPGQPVGEVLSRLDQALLRAESAGRCEVEFLAHDEGQQAAQPHGAGHWQQLLHGALQQPGALALHTQVLACSGPHGQRRQHEASLALLDTDSGTQLAGALFLPAAVRLGLSGDFDLQALQLGLQWLQEHPGEHLVLRISQPSLVQAGFLRQLCTALQQVHPALLASLTLELDAYALQASPEEVGELATAVYARGARVGLRRLDQSPMALAQLHQLPLRYAKLGGDFAEQALASPGGEQLLIAMLQTAQALKIELLVSSPVTAQAAALLQRYGACLPAA